MNGPKRLRHEQRREEILGEHLETKETQFDSVEELLRHDRVQTAPDPGIAARLQASLAVQPVKAEPWWKRLFPKW